MADVFDAVTQVGRQGVAVSDQQQMRLGEAAERGAGVGEIGGAAPAIAVRVIGADLAECGREGAQVQADDLNARVFRDMRSARARREKVTFSSPSSAMRYLATSRIVSSRTRCRSVRAKWAGFRSWALARRILRGVVMGVVLVGFSGNVNNKNNASPGAVCTGIPDRRFRRRISGGFVAERGKPRSWHSSLRWLSRWASAHRR